jgi:hypothetical protein
MANYELLLGETKVFVPRLALVTKCQIFLENPVLLMSPYPVHSAVSADIFQLFTEAIIGARPEIQGRKLPNLQCFVRNLGFPTARKLPIL